MANEFDALSPHFPGAPVLYDEVGSRVASFAS